MRETSIVVVLDELRDLQAKRVADEVIARERDRAARCEAEAARVRVARDAEAAAAKAAREGELAIELARESAERDARVRIATAEATERARLDAELTAEREAAERVLRREAIQRQRPRWMVAVTALAVIATIALAVAAIGQQREAERARQEQIAAACDRDHAKAAAHQAQVELDALGDKLVELQGTVDRAVARVVAAKNAAEREAAQAALADARHEIWITQQQQADAKRRKDEGIRKHGLHVEDCAKSSIGCIDH